MPVNAVVSYIIAMVISGSIGLAVTESGLSAIDVVLARCAIGCVAVAAYCVWSRSFRGVHYTWRTLALRSSAGYASSPTGYCSSPHSHSPRSRSRR